MGNITAGRDTRKYGSLPLPEVLPVPQKGAVVIFPGGMVGIDANGLAQPATAAGTVAIIGVADTPEDQGSFTSSDSTGLADAAISCRVRQGMFKMDNGAGGDAITKAAAGQRCYASDDHTVNLTDLLGTRVAAGRIMQVDSDGVWVIFGLTSPEAVGAGGSPKGVLAFPLDLASIAAAQVVGAITPGFAGRILKTFAVTNKPATTGAKAATLTTRISGVAVTGGVVALTSANQTPQGNVVAGTAVTAANTFGATDTIDVQGSAVTAFVEGSTTLFLVLG